MSNLAELTKTATENQDKIKAIFDEAGKDMDFDKVKSVSGTTEEKLDTLKKMQDDADSEWKIIEGIQKAQKQHADLDGRTRTPAPDEKFSHPGEGAGQVERKSFRTILTGSDEYKNYVGGGMAGRKELNYNVPDLGIRELKTLFETTAGWPPESIRIGTVAMLPVQPPLMIDIVPDGATGQAAVPYMRETVRTNAAAETAEGTVYPESTYELAQDSSPVVKIAHFVPVTDEQLEDVPQAESYLTDNLISGTRERVSSQIINGDGTPPNLEGILAFPGIQDHPTGTDPIPDAIYKAMTLIRTVGRAEPTNVVLNPLDWEEIRLLRTADGVYIWGNPSEAGPDRIWGKPVLQTTEQPENTGLVGAFSPQYIMLFNRRGVDVQVGYTGTQFIDGIKTIRADVRVALVGFRENAFATVSDLSVTP